MANVSESALAEHFARLTAAVEKLNAAAAALAEKRVAPGIPVAIDLWDIETIAQYLKRKENTVRNRIICLPNFPTPIHLQNDKVGAARPLWKAAEVIQWATNPRAGSPGRPRKVT